jgi:ATP-dependent exoDNAse (exonuclease V) alpha subunit
MTSHSSQGITAERVLVNMDTEVHPELINRRFAYVSVSRASHEAHIYTNNAASLGENLSHNVTKTSAVDFSKGHNLPTQHDFDQGSGQAKLPEVGLGLAL